jgi:hypothetical protein
MIFGCDIVEVCSIVVNDFCIVKMTHSNDNGKMVRVHISQIETI